MTTNERASGSRLPASGSQEPLAESRITIRVNGEDRPVAAGTTVTRLLEQLGVSTARVAVERNFEIVPKVRYAEVQLQPGDTVEIVQFVGGG